MASCTAVVARDIGRYYTVGCNTITVHVTPKEVHASNRRFQEGEAIDVEVDSIAPNLGSYPTVIVLAMSLS